MISRFLDTNFDGTGTKNAVGNYSGVEEKFGIQPATNQVYAIERMIVSIGDASGVRADRYGGLAGGLSNGISLRVENYTGTVYALTDSDSLITTNASWGAYCYDVELKTWGSGPELLVARWTFAKSGTPVWLNGSEGERLVVALNDDCSDLTDHRFLVQGHYKRKYSS